MRVVDNFFTLVHSHLCTGCEVFTELVVPDEEGTVFKVLYFLCVFEDEVVA